MTAEISDNTDSQDGELLSCRMNATRDEISAFCKQWHVIELAVFGSILRDDFNHESDIDILVTFDKSNYPTFFKFIRMEQQLAEICGRKVDLMTRISVENNKNYIRRKAILKSARVIYET